MEEENKNNDKSAYNLSLGDYSNADNSSPADNAPPAEEREVKAGLFEQMKNSASEILRDSNQMMHVILGMAIIIIIGILILIIQIPSQPDDAGEIEYLPAIEDYNAAQ